MKENGASEEKSTISGAILSKQSDPRRKITEASLELTHARANDWINFYAGSKADRPTDRCLDTGYYSSFEDNNSVRRYSKPMVIRKRIEEERSKVDEI
jgi:hypothetical protein